MTDDRAASDWTGLLASALADVGDRLGRTVVIGLAGPQGSGKTTLAGRMARWLSDRGRSVVTRSIDDFYLTQAERQQLAADVHPLLATRGVPGTHDIPLAMEVLESLRTASAGQEIPLPAFDKAVDDRIDCRKWPRHVGRPDIVLLEGWCVGAEPQPGTALARPINALEREEDRDGRWRAFVNDHLRMDYAALFAQLDFRVLLRAPSFEQVLVWRSEQEAGLDRSAPDARPPMTEGELRRFISHYERLTRWMMAKASADILIDLDAGRRPVRWQGVTPADG